MVLDAVFNEINQQLELLGLKIKSAETAIVDATIITSQARPRKVLELVSEEENQDRNSNNNEEKQSVSSVEYSADPDARWLKKGKKYYFGYQAFARADAEGFIDKTHVTPANLAECKEFGEMVSGTKPGTRILADKGFFSAENKQILREKNLKNGLMYKGFRGNPLSLRKILFNKLISKKRWRIEQCFGTLKRRFLFTKSSYFTTKKVDAQFKMKMMCLNLLKALNKVKIA
jgi:IS5 family transposase